MPRRERKLKDIKKEVKNAARGSSSLKGWIQSCNSQGGVKEKDKESTDNEDRDIREAGDARQMIMKMKI
ncbi:unnamed protein product [Arctogadus glacialis]